MTSLALYALVASFSIVIAGLAGAAEPGAGTGAMPAVHSHQGVRYTSGGIGLDESTAMKAAASQWPLSLEFAIQTGGRAEYASNVKVLVRNSQGATVLQATSQGPFLLAELPPGSYQIEATLGGKTLQRQATVRSGQSAHVVLEWPAGTDSPAQK
ncbi:MAG: carboxypeptidase-like regulatory domain-containing protein [Comamonas sp.]